MTAFSSKADLGAVGPGNLWEAVAMLSRVQEQQAVALREGDRMRLRRLLSEQAVAWAFVRGFAEQLVERGEAPQGMVERLRRALKIREERETELREAYGRLDERRRQAA
jgi:hypothetical protein